MSNLLFFCSSLDRIKYGIKLNLDLSILNKQQILDVGSLFLNNLLLICPNQTLTAKQFASICYSWGTPQILNKNQYDELNDNDKKRIQKLGVGKLLGLIKVSALKDEDNDLIGILGDDEIIWHTDGSGNLNPPEVIALYANQVGDNNHTDFLECVTPYQKLSYEDKKVVDDLKYIHFYDEKTIPKYNEKYSNSFELQSKLIFSSEIANKYITLPLIIQSPGGHKGFRYNRGSFVRFINKTEKESEELKKWIESLLFKDQYMYTHHWKPGDLLFIDQTVMLHRRRKQDFSKRILYRMQFNVSKLKCSLK